MDISNHRKPNRLQGYDYSLPGYYFVTACTHNRVRWFGEVVGGEMILSRFGKIASRYGAEIPEHYPDVTLDEWVVMSNHIHMILVVGEPAIAVGRESVGIGHCPVPTTNAGEMPYVFDVEGDDGIEKYGLVSKVVKSFKEIVTKTVRHETSQMNFGWQRSFHDRIVRDQEALDAIRSYNRANPANWERDRNFGR